MPGLSQLKKFNADILSLGNEPALRAARGEKPVTIPIPKDIKDVNDADDFLMGMPEPVENPVVSDENENAPEDFSDIMGTSSNSTSSESESAPQINISVPDLSSISSMNGSDDFAPDLSMFDEPVQETVEPELEKEPEKPEEKELSEFSLEDLLGGTGFDGSQGEINEDFAEDNSEQSADTEQENSEEQDIPDAEPVEEISGEPFGTETSEEANPFSGVSLDDLVSDVENTPDNQKFGSSDLDMDSFAKSADSDSNSNDDFAQPIVEEPISAETIPDDEVSAADEKNTSVDNFDFEEPEINTMENPDENEAFKNSDFSDISDLDLDVPDFSGAVDVGNKEENESDGGSSSAEDSALQDSGEIPMPDENIKSPEAEATDKEFAFSGNEIDMGEGLPDSVTEADSVPENRRADSDNSGFSEEKSVDLSGDDFDLPEGLFDSSDFEIPETSEDVSDAEKGSETSKSIPETEPERVSSSAESEIAENSHEASSESNENDDLSSPDDGFPEDFNFDLNDFSDDSNDSNFGTEQKIDESVPTEKFDTSEMEGLDFGIPDTDSALEKGNFELGNSDDFAPESSDFEIPGFSDVDTVEVGKNGKIKVPVAKNESENQEKNSDEIPPNTLTDEQYKKFIKNLSFYPLNVRMAVEELIVKNEFTDEAEFAIIQKVLKRVSARSLASELEKMLDIAIPVPRDFERRTAEEYEAYKSSFQYQLSNKIIPGAVLSVGALIVFFFMFQFVHYFVYNPARANSLYRQGYKLLESENYPQSEVKFTEATKFQHIKKWFFRYAQGYREHKQYIRAEQMYKNILYCFNHDKAAGLEYAEMEYKDLANYENAEQILLRDVLDYHINDPDGILMLGDNYLEWADEKDSSKYDEALKRYAELVQLYGATDKYLGRMMRYYIRTDNLKEVLNLKERFFPRPKSLEPSDWTELSGYYFDKLYGKLSPSDEYLRARIEDVKELLVRAVKTDSENPVPYYNIARYYINTNNSLNAEKSLTQAIKTFEKTNIIKKKDLYKNIDSYRLLGEIYMNDKDFLKALESYTSGITLFTNSKEGSGLEGTSQVGNLYSDLGDIEYFISGDYDSALQNYKDAVDNDFDNGKIRYKIGYIQYSKGNYPDAIGSFMKAGEDYSDDQNLLLAMGNSLSLRNDNFAAQGYYERLLEQISSYKAQQGMLFPQVRKDDAEIVDSYLKASNNLGVTFYRLAQRTGSSSLNAKAMVNFQESLRAWDSMTRNQQTMVRLGGSNLAEQNLKYVTHPLPEFEPAIYTEISKTLAVEKGLSQ